MTTNLPAVIPRPPGIVARPRHRPSTYSREIAARICAMIAESNHSLRDLCKMHDDLPSRATINRWLAEHAEFRREYAIAAQGRVEDIAFECLQIADDGDRDVTSQKNNDGIEVVVVDKEHFQRTEQRLRERHWLCARLMPKRFGDTPTADQPEMPQLAKPDEDAVETPMNGLAVRPEDNPLYYQMQEWRKAGGKT